MPYRDSNRRRANAASYRKVHSEEMKAYNAAWQILHAEEIKARHALYRAAHFEEEKAHNSAWRKAHPDRRKVIRATYYKAHKEAVQAYNTAYRKAHPEMAKAIGARYRKAHPDKIYEKNARAQSWRRGLPTERVSREAIYEKEHGLCHICAKKISKREMTLDHIIPASKGGGYTYANLRLAHKSCNSRRGAGRIPAQIRMV